MNETIINATEIESLYRGYRQENKMEFSKEEFQNFLKFIEIDFYDWIRENLKQFGKQ